MGTNEGATLAQGMPECEQQTQGQALAPEPTESTKAKVANDARSRCARSEAYNSPTCKANGSLGER
jgi:hypothetical protein